MAKSSSSGAALKATDRRITMRLVKGAYWDSEIKRAQERGLAGYPVFTRKANTDGVDIPQALADQLRTLAE